MSAGEARRSSGLGIVIAVEQDRQHQIYNPAALLFAEPEKRAPEGGAQLPTFFVIDSGVRETMPLSFRVARQLHGRNAGVTERFVVLEVPVDTERSRGEPTLRRGADGVARRLDPLSG